MTIGTSLLIIAVGAILRYAVTIHSTAVNFQTIGVILMIVGIVGLVLSLVWMAVGISNSRTDRYERPPDTTELR